MEREDNPEGLLSIGWKWGMLVCLERQFNEIWWQVGNVWAPFFFFFFVQCPLPNTSKFKTRSRKCVPHRLVGSFFGATSEQAAGIACFIDGWGGWDMYNVLKKHHGAHFFPLITRLDFLLFVSGVPLAPSLMGFIWLLSKGKCILLSVVFIVLLWNTCGSYDFRDSS